jgi:predicted negative regulator of RcsB-dependent stress response
MDEDIAIIDSNTRKEKIKNFFIQNKKILIIYGSIFLILILSYFAFIEFTKNKKVDISDEYNSIIIKYSQNEKQETKKQLVKLINKKDPTYSPLSLYFIIDNKLVNDLEEMNKLFDTVIEKISLKEEIKNLIVYKKALYNADYVDENQLLDILKPIINSKSIWKSHALYLVAEYFFSKNEKQKSKEFFTQILNIDNPNQDLKIKAQKRLNRDLSE